MCGVDRTCIALRRNDVFRFARNDVAPFGGNDAMFAIKCGEATHH